MAANDNNMVFDTAERFVLDPGSPVPLYHQMEQILLERLSKAEMVGRQLPSEYELIDMFGVSRATVKKTLDNLVNKGLLERRRGIGTRVIKHQIIEDLARLKSYTEEMASKNLAIRTTILGVSAHAPNADVAAKLRLSAKAKTLCIRRLRGTTDVFPVVLLQSEIPEVFGVRKTEDFTRSLYALLETTYRIPVIWGEETIEASTATAEQARHLGIKTGATVLVMERISYTHDNRPVEYVKGVYRPDRYKFSIRLNR